MKTALITYHAAHNNGSFLQAFATQKAIEQLGHECDVIDFSTPRQQYLYDVYKKVSGPKDIAKNLYALLHHNTTYSCPAATRSGTWTRGTIPMPIC